MALTTPERLKRYLGIDPADSGEDELLAELVASASSWFETQIDRTFAVSSYTDRRTGNGAAELYTLNYPPVAVTSVAVADVPIPSASVSIVNERVVLADGYAFTRGAAVVIVYTAGYAATPEDVAQAVTEYAALKYRERGRFGHTQVNVTGEDTIPDQTKSGPSFAAVMDVVRSYRRMSF